VASTTSRTSCTGNNQSSDTLAAQSPVSGAVDGRVSADAERPLRVDQATSKSGGDDPEDTLRRRLRDTVETCQRLATTLDARHGSRTTNGVSHSRTSLSNQSTGTTQQQPDVDKVRLILSNFYVTDD